MSDLTESALGMSDLTVARLLQNPLGQEAPVGHRGDIVRVSDGRASLYLLPWEFEAVDEARLRWLLAQKATPAHPRVSTVSSVSYSVSLRPPIGPTP